MDKNIVSTKNSLLYSEYLVCLTVSALHAGRGNMQGRSSDSNTLVHLYIIIALYVSEYYH